MDTPDDKSMRRRSYSQWAILQVSCLLIHYLPMAANVLNEWISLIFSGPNQ